VADLPSAPFPPRKSRPRSLRRAAPRPGRSLVASVAGRVPAQSFPASGARQPITAFDPFAARSGADHPAPPRAAIRTRIKTMKQFIPLALACFPLIVMIGVWNGTV
jgi:hypothetical protein